MRAARGGTAADAAAGTGQLQDEKNTAASAWQLPAEPADYAVSAEEPEEDAVTLCMQAQERSLSLYESQLDQLLSSLLLSPAAPSSFEGADFLPPQQQTYSSYAVVEQEVNGSVFTEQHNMVSACLQQPSSSEIAEQRSSSFFFIPQQNSSSFACSEPQLLQQQQTSSSMPQQAFIAGPAAQEQPQQQSKWLWRERQMLGRLLRAFEEAEGKQPQLLQREAHRVAQRLQQLQQQADMRAAVALKMEWEQQLMEEARNIVGALLRLRAVREKLAAALAQDDLLAAAAAVIQLQGVRALFASFDAKYAYRSCRPAAAGSPPLPPPHSAAAASAPPSGACETRSSERDSSGALSSTRSSDAPGDGSRPPPPLAVVERAVLQGAEQLQQQLVLRLRDRLRAAAAALAGAPRRSKTAQQQPQKTPEERAVEEQENKQQQMQEQQQQDISRKELNMTFHLLTALRMQEEALRVVMQQLKQQLADDSAKRFKLLLQIKKQQNADTQVPGPAAAAAAEREEPQRMLHAAAVARLDDAAAAMITYQVKALGAAAALPPPAFPTAVPGPCSSSSNDPDNTSSSLPYHSSSSEGSNERRRSSGSREEGAAAMLYALVSLRQEVDIEGVRLLNHFTECKEDLLAMKPEEKCDPVDLRRMDCTLVETAALSKLCTQLHWRFVTAAARASRPLLLAKTRASSALRPGTGSSGSSDAAAAVSACVRSSGCAYAHAAAGAAAAARAALATADERGSLVDFVRRCGALAGRTFEASPLLKRREELAAQYVSLENTFVTASLDQALNVADELCVDSGEGGGDMPQGWSGLQQAQQFRQDGFSVSLAAAAGVAAGAGGAGAAPAGDLFGDDVEEEEEDDRLYSTLVDDLFFILNKSVLRAIDTADVLAACAVVNNVCNTLSCCVKQKLRRNLEESKHFYADYVRSEARVRCYSLRGCLEAAAAQRQHAAFPEKPGSSYSWPHSVNNVSLAVQTLKKFKARVAVAFDRMVEEQQLLQLGDERKRGGRRRSRGRRSGRRRDGSRDKGHAAAGAAADNSSQETTDEEASDEEEEEEEDSGDGDTASADSPAVAEGRLSDVEAAAAETAAAEEEAAADAAEDLAAAAVSPARARRGEDKAAAGRTAAAASVGGGGTTRSSSSSSRNPGSKDRNNERIMFEYTLQAVDGIVEELHGLHERCCRVTVRLLQSHLHRAMDALHDAVYEVYAAGEAAPALCAVEQLPAGTPAASAPFFSAAAAASPHAGGGDGGMSEEQQRQQERWRLLLQRGIALILNHVGRVYDRASQALTCSLLLQLVATKIEAVLLDKSYTALGGLQLSGQLRRLLQQLSLLHHRRPRQQRDAYMQQQQAPIGSSGGGGFPLSQGRLSSQVGRAAAGGGGGAAAAAASAAAAAGGAAVDAGSSLLEAIAAAAGGTGTSSAISFEEAEGEQALQHVRVFCDTAVRPKFGRLLEIGELLSLWSLEELADIWGPASGKFWRLTDEEVKRVLERRVEFAHENIEAFFKKHHLQQNG